MVKISVILPVYNHARWVEQAITSVLAQTLPAFELIIIDDASSDASWERIQAVCAKVHNIKLTCLRHEVNQGAPATLNQGLQLAQGDYLAILNSDDVWDSARLERLASVAVAQQAAFLCTDVSLLDAEGQPQGASEPHWLAWFNGLKHDLASHGDFWATLLRGNFLITTSNFFMQRQVYAQVGEFAELRYVHDYDYALRVMLAGFKLHFLADEYLLAYRLHDSNTIREKPLAAIAENMRLLLNWLPALANVLNERRLQGLQTQLQDLYRYTGEEWLTVVHQRLVAKEHELLPLISDRDHWIAERDAIISQQAQQIADRNRWISERDRWIADRDGWIAERDALITQQAADIAARDVWIAERDHWITQRDVWITERDTLIRQLQQQQQAVYNSRAFRLGEAVLAPLRLLRQCWRGFSHA